MGEITIVNQSTVCTQHIAKYMWTIWTSDGKPDLSPLSLDLTILPSIKAACERSASDLIESTKNLPPELQSDALASPLRTMYELSFEELNTSAFKLLKKVFADVQKNYYTVTLQDPTGRNPDYTGYTPAYAFPDIELLVKERGVYTGTEPITAAQRTESLKQNACKKLGSTFVCGQPVSCQTMCKFWCPPDDSYQGQCYYQIRNKEQTAKDLSDAFLCGNEEAILDASSF